MKKTIEERVSSVCTEWLLEECRSSGGYVNKSLLTEAMIDQVIFDAATGLFREREFDSSIVKSDLIRRHLQKDAT